VLLNAGGLDDGIHEAEIRFTSNDPYTPTVTVPVTLNVGVVEPSWVDFDPDVLNLGANGNTVLMKVELPGWLDPRMIDPCSVLLNDAVPVVGCPGTPPPSAVGFSDDWPMGGNGIEEINLKFDRVAVAATLGAGEDVPVWIQGEVADIQWWRGSASVRAIRPQVTSPAGGEYFIAGWNVPIRWLPPDWNGDVTYTVQLSRDGGNSWEMLATGLQAEAFDWTADAGMTAGARIRVLAFDVNGALLGYDETDRDFVLGGPVLLAPRPIDPDGLLADHGPAGTFLLWKMPIADLAYGPASAFKIMTSSQRGGTFTQQAMVAGTEYADASGDPGPGEVIFYKVVATNAAGDAQ
jgi:hypothetical protein